MLIRTLVHLGEHSHILLINGSPFPEQKDFEEMLDGMPEESKHLFLEFHLIAIDAIMHFAQNEEYIGWLYKICNALGLSGSNQFRAEVTLFYFEYIFQGYSGSIRNNYELSLKQPSQKALDQMRETFSKRSLELQLISDLGATVATLSQPIFEK